MSSVVAPPGITICQGDCAEVLQRFPAEGIDSVVTDPPYGLGFMGKEWDHGVPGVPFWVEFLRVAKPGAHLVAFGGTRTWHRLACAIEDAGWEMRDSLAWMYGQGFPKSLNLDGAWAGWGTALKPAFEPVILARKPLIGTVEANVQQYGTGALNIDACRIEVPDQKGGASYAGGSSREVGRARSGPGLNFAQLAGDPNDGLGRWPANVVLDEEAAEMLDGQTGTLTSGRVGPDGFAGPPALSVALGRKRALIRPENVYGDSGGASRFFYVAKASRSERTHGGTVENKHPTVKPLALTEWLIKLVTPPGGVVLDPFAGSGTTPVAAARAGFDCIAIEKDVESWTTMRSRVAKAAT